MMRLVLAAVLWSVAAFYLYGAGVHVANMLSLTGFDWRDAPLKWQVLDIMYLILDLSVAVGLGFRWCISIAAFYLAAFSQIVLYSAGRNWVLDVPDAFQPSADDLIYLDTLILFHVVTIVAVSASLFWLRDRARR